MIRAKGFRAAVAAIAATTLFFSPIALAAQQTVPSGARATLALSSWLSSKDAEAGDTFEATLVSDITSEGQLIVPAGAIFVGRVADVERGRGLSRGGKLTLVIDRLVSGDGESAAAPGTVTGLEDGEDLEGEEDKGKKAAIGGGIGGVVGAIVGGTTGLLVGLAVGAGGAIAAGKGKDVELPEGTHLLVKFDREIEVTWNWRPIG